MEEPIAQEYPEYSVIKTKRSVHRHLYDIESWDFYYDDGTVARKKAFLNGLNNLRCYLLEDSFSSIFENGWENVLKTFIDEVKNAHPIPALELDRKISEKTVENMMKFFFMMLCRSPQFDPMGVDTSMNNSLKQNFFDAEQIDEIKEAIWFTELYRMFYKENGGFLYSSIPAAP